jgi:hypothetical protein
VMRIADEDVQSHSHAVRRIRANENATPAERDTCGSAIVLQA